MEVLSAHMAPVFKGEESWKYKRVYDTKHARQSDAKVEINRSERASNYEAGSGRKRKLHAAGSGNGWEGGGSGRQAPASGGARTVARLNSEAGNASNGYVKRQDAPQQESSEEEEFDTSQDAHADDTDLSGDDEPVAPEATAEAPQKWPIIQIVDPPPWLPEGWTAVLRTRESGSKDKYYVDPVSQRRFRSKTEVNYFLQTGKSYRYKRNLALLTKPLKEDPASLPNTVPLRTVSSDVLGVAGHSGLYGADYKSMGAGAAKSSQAADLRLAIVSTQSEAPRKPYNKPGPKPKVKVAAEDSGRALVASVKSRLAVDERRPSGASPPQGAENRGKLILKLKRKSAESDEGLGNGKKARPFEVVGSTPVMQGKSRSTTSEEGSNRKNRWAVDHAVEVTSRASASHSLVPSTHLSRRPISKAPLPQWHHQGLASSLARSQFGAAGPFLGGIVNGQSHLLEKVSVSAANLAAKEAEAARGPSKRESPAEQLQRLGRKLCQQAVFVLCSDDGTGNTLKQVSLALSAAMSQRGLNGGVNTQLPAFNPAFFYAPSSAPSPAPAAYQQLPPPKKMRGAVSKGKTIIPVQKYAMDRRYALAPYSR